MLHMTRHECCPETASRLAARRHVCDFLCAAPAAVVILSPCAAAFDCQHVFRYAQPRLPACGHLCRSPSVGPSTAAGLRRLASSLTDRRSRQHPAATDTTSTAPAAPAARGSQSGPLPGRADHDGLRLAAAGVLPARLLRLGRRAAAAGVACAVAARSARQADEHLGSVCRAPLAGQRLVPQPAARLHVRDEAPHLPEDAYGL